MEEITKQNRNILPWKWLAPILFLIICIVFFFSMTGNALFRYGSAYLQPGLIEEAYEIANQNEIVTQKLGKLSPYTFLRLIEGHVAYTNDNTIVKITVNLIGTKKKGKLDIVALREGENWKYQKIVVRIKKPQKETITILENNNNY